MKKILVAILGGAIGLSAVAQTVVYDYKATFKRINPIIKIRKVNKVDTVTESYDVSSDTISGYVMLPVCDDCFGPVDTGNNRGHAYLTRKGDKYSKAANIPFVTKVDVWAESAVFGQNAFIEGRAPADTDPADEKELKKAWMWLWFDMHDPLDLTLAPAPAVGVVADAGHHILANQVVKKLAVDAKDPLSYLWYGFMGLDNSLGGWVDNAGFGSVKIYSSSSSLGLCGRQDGRPCRLIQNISGSTLGDFTYQGICTGIPMWDLCAPDAMGAGANVWQPPVINMAPIAGTWTLKLNTTLTKITGANPKAKRDAQELAIYKKLKVDTTSPATIAKDVFTGAPGSWDETTAWDYDFDGDGVRDAVDGDWYPGY